MTTEEQVISIAAGDLLQLDVIPNRQIPTTGNFGPTFKVWVADGKEVERTGPVEVLRFDCFDQDPHYHYMPGWPDERSAGEKWPMDPSMIGDLPLFVLHQLKTYLPEMLKHAGFPETARALDMAPVRVALDAAQHFYQSKVVLAAEATT